MEVYKILGQAQVVPQACSTSHRIQGGGVCVCVCVGVLGGGVAGIKAYYVYCSS